MSKIIIPGQNRTNVQIGQKQRACVLVHAETKRILCFCMDDHFAASFENAGYIKHELIHASDYDLWAKRLREQTSREHEAEDHAYLEREDAVRKRLRQQLQDVMISGHKSNADKLAAKGALQCLESMEARKKRYREESFMVNEGFEATANAGEELIEKIMMPKEK